MGTSKFSVGETVTLTIERMAYGGDGLGHSQGKVVFVPQSAVGDQLEVTITEDHPRYSRGTIDKILVPSPHRIEPRCSVFGKCGGCHWQHLDYETQLRSKEAIFRETFIHMGGFKDPPIEPILAAPRPWEYRERIRLKVDQEVGVGFYAAGSHEVIPFDHCSISHPRLNQSLPELERPRHDFELVWDPQTEQVTTHLDESPYRRFAQVSSEQNKQLLQTVIDYVDPQPKEDALELYCGAGNFSLPLAPRFKSLLAVDQNASAIRKAEQEARAQGLSQVTFRQATVEWGLKKMLRRRLFPDTLILDPPRQGAQEILDLIAVLSAHKIVYISCDPPSLVRDLKFLKKKGYRLVRARPIDMFPQTYHIEGVVQLLHT